MKKYFFAFVMLMILIASVAFAQVAAPTPASTPVTSPDVFSMIASKINAVVGWFTAHYGTISGYAAVAFAFLFSKVWPNSKAPRIIATVQGVFDGIAAVGQAIVDGAHAMASFCMDLLKSDGIGGSK